jgi:hypothetical protein
MSVCSIDPAVSCSPATRCCSTSARTPCWNRIRPLTERRRSLLECIESLDVLASLPLTGVFPGHGPVIKDPRLLIVEMREHHRERADDLAGMLTEEGRSAWQLANELFTDLEGFDNFLAVSEVVAHIDLLVEQGRAEPVQQGGVTYYRVPRARPQGSGAGLPAAGSVREP